MQAKGLPDCTGLIINSIFAEHPQYGITTVASKINDLDAARAGGGTQVSALRKQLGQRNCDITITSLLIDLLDYYNVKNGFSDGQIRMTVELINSDFWHLKIEQIARAFHLQKIGKLLKIFERLDPSVIVEIITTYEKTLLTGFHETDALKYKERYDYDRAIQRNQDAEQFNSIKAAHLRANPPINPATQQ